jgi:ATP phosphoribosyltransferase
VDIVSLQGSVELGPITGMSEAIVDLVATGTTLRENGLIEIQELYKSTARLIANPVSYRLDRYEMQDVLEQLRSKLAETSKG